MSEGGVNIDETLKEGEHWVRKVTIMKSFSFAVNFSSTEKHNSPILQLNIMPEKFVDPMSDWVTVLSSTSMTLHVGY